MSLKNQVQLITYVDRLANGGLDKLNTLLSHEFAGLFGGVHLLPFFNPIDGEDAGFDPIDHTQVDKRIGTWADIASIGATHDIMADLIVNHVSAQSLVFQDVLAQGSQSPYFDLIMTKEKVFGLEASQADIDKIYRPRPTPCFTPMTCATGEVMNVWTTFTSNQIDIDVTGEQGQAYLDRILDTFEQNNIKLIRLDAAGYAIKKAGTNCFMLDDTFDFINALSAKANTRGMNCLVEIHSYYKTQIEIAKRCEAVYDFALPPLVLHTLFNNDAQALYDWLSIAPRNCVTVLDTHDGIGIVDVGPEGDKPGLLTHQQIDNLVESIHHNSQNQSRKATGAAASNVDLYQVNCTYLDALGNNKQDYLLARAIQFFAPGIPQVYYAGVLGLNNDMTLLAKSQVGRDINRPYLDDASLQNALNTPFFAAMKTLIILRNTHPAFNGEFTISLKDHSLKMQWQLNEQAICLHIDTENHVGSITTMIDNINQQTIDIKDESIK
jgi:sucrose phosphorylase